MQRRHRPYDYILYDRRKKNQYFRVTLKKGSVKFDWNKCSGRCMYRSPNNTLLVNKKTTDWLVKNAFIAHSTNLPYAFLFSNFRRLFYFIFQT